MAQVKSLDFPNACCPTRSLYKGLAKQDNNADTISILFRFVSLCLCVFMCVCCSFRLRRFVLFLLFLLFFSLLAFFRSSTELDSIRFDSIRNETKRDKTTTTKKRIHHPSIIHAGTHTENENETRERIDESPRSLVALPRTASADRPQLSFTPHQHIPTHKQAATPKQFAHSFLAYIYIITVVL